jgi:hypothetical protein
MFVNNYQINLSTLSTGTTATTINIPISLEYQMVDQYEIVERVFVDVETEKAINPIVDFEKTRFIPTDLNNNPINKVIYTVTFTGGTTYGDIGFENNDVKFLKESFTQTFLNLNFYDSDNPLTQNLVTNITLYARLKSDDLQPIGSNIVGQPKPVNQIPLVFVLENPTTNPRGFSEGFFIYDYKDEVTIEQPKFLYMRASFINAKTGTTTNLMVKPDAQPIDMLIHELYTRYKLYKTDSGFYYQIDNTYQGNNPDVPSANNVSYTTNTFLNDVTVNLYQILST